MNPGGDWDVRDLAIVEVDKERCQAKENVAVGKDKVSEDSTRLSAGAGAGNSSLLIGAKWKNRAKVYGCHLMASWGDRMWLFAIGLYMIKLYPESLKLTAIYGITLAGSILVFGSFIGAWIDRTCRITAARVALIIQNSSVALCSILLICVITFNAQLTSLGTWASPLSQAMIVFVADIAALAAEASRIILEKDWIVVIASEDRALLASYNSVLRAIDLGSNILAPTCVGFLMSWMSSTAAAFFLCAWNIFSMVLEYVLLTNIFKTFPDLAVKSNALRASNKSSTATLAGEQSNDEAAPADEVECRGAPDDDEGTKTVFSWLKKAVLGWGIYFRHEVFAAGLGLALLYMTVLGFDQITTAFAYSQGVEPWILGILSGIGALNGMIGALCFPFLCGRLGLRRTGILGFSLETVMLTASLISIALPGSPFKYYTYQPSRPNQSANWTHAGLDLILNQRSRTCKSCGDFNSSYTLMEFNDTGQWGTYDTPPRAPSANGARPLPMGLTEDVSCVVASNVTKREVDVDFESTPAALNMEETAAIAGGKNNSNARHLDEVAFPPYPPAVHQQDAKKSPNISIMFFLGGIIAARFGLWVADLTVTQVLQEQVREDQRGIINGIQTSMNQLLDLVKFVLVVMIPETESFAFLIMASYIFVCMGWLSFMVYCVQTVYRGTGGEPHHHHQPHHSKPREETTATDVPEPSPTPHDVVRDSIV